MTREDNKDEAGAGDLYYGEMEMGRRDERLLLWLYWIVSGYGVRPGRALASLTVTIVGAATLLTSFGFHHERNYGRSLIFALESSISLLRPPDAGLSAGGQLVQIGLRLFGPLLFGLALLSIRARIKR